jgi:hypothetical protein
MALCSLYEKERKVEPTDRQICLPTDISEIATTCCFSWGWLLQLEERIGDLGL